MRYHFKRLWYPSASLLDHPSPTPSMQEMENGYDKKKKKKRNKRKS